MFHRRGNDGDGENSMKLWALYIYVGLTVLESDKQSQALYNLGLKVSELKG